MKRKDRRKQFHKFKMKLKEFADKEGATYTKEEVFDLVAEAVAQKPYHPTKQ